MRSSLLIVVLGWCLEVRLCSGLKLRRFFATTISGFEEVLRSEIAALPDVSSVRAQKLQQLRLYSSSPKLLDGFSTTSDASRLVAESETIFIVPLVKLKGEHFMQLRDDLTKSKSSVKVSKFCDLVMPRRDLISALDGSPFVQAVPDVLDGSSLVIFSREGAFYSELIKWYNSVQVDSNVEGVLILYKEKMLKLGVTY